MLKLQCGHSDGSKPVQTQRTTVTLPMGNHGTPIKGETQMTINNENLTVKLTKKEKQAIKDATAGTRVDVSTGKVEGAKEEEKTIMTPEQELAILKAENEALKATTVELPKVAKEFPLCKCGCEERTRGGMFRPGHDAKYYSRLGGHSPKPTSSGYHSIDTTMGLVRKMSMTELNILASLLAARIEGIEAEQEAAAANETK
jgi:hypothetical protein